MRREERRGILIKLVFGSEQENENERKETSPFILASVRRIGYPHPLDQIARW